MNARLVLAVTAFLAFTAYSVSVAAADGALGFLDVALREPWGMQMLVDLAVACTVIVVWMIPDAKRLGIPAWPYVVAVLGTGSVGTLAYLVHRELRLRRSEVRAT